MLVGKIVTYTTLFGPNAKIPKSNDLLKDISSDLLIHYYSFINTVLYLDPTNINLEKWILKQILFRFPQEQRIDFEIRLLRIFRDNRNQFVKFFPSISLLDCIQDELKRNNRGDIGEPTKEQEFNILINVLVKNELIDKKLTSKIGDLGEIDDEKLYKLIWTISFPYSEFLFPKSIMTAAFKCLKFLEFVHASPFLNKYSKDFAKTTKDYLMELFLLIKNAQIDRKWKLTSMFKEENFTSSEVIKRIVYDLNSGKPLSSDDLNDYKLLRNFPILKVNDSYSITNWNFIVDKFYPAIIYDFYNTTQVKNEFKGRSDKEKINTYLSHVGTVFGERILFKEIFEGILRQQSKNLIIGDDNGKNFDLYCRVDRHIFLFEYKNIMMPKKQNYSEIKDILRNRFVKSNDSKKGILQLLDQIEKLAENPKEFEDFNDLSKNTNQLVIYPIIIYTDPALTLHGINSYLNKIFKDELAKLKPKIKFRVQDLILISYDFFFDAADLFRRRRIDLVYLLNYYYTKQFERRKRILKEKKNPIDIHSPFEEIVQPYMNKKLGEKTYDGYYHRYLRKSLFPEEYESK